MNHRDLSDFHPSGEVFSEARHRVPTLQAGGFYEGQCGLPLPHHNLVEVRLHGHDQVVPCVWVAGFFSGLIGVNSTFTPPEGTRVLIYHTGRDFSFIVGAWPDTRTVDVSRSATGAAPVSHLPLFQSTQARTADLLRPREHAPPGDLLPGELDLTNLQEVGIRLLRNLAVLQAGDLAKVECHLLDDLVRIVAQNFRHHSAIGDHSITNDHGRLNAVWHAAARDHEAWGLARPGDPRVPVEGESGVPPPAAGAEIEGRWRYSQFLGWLGDFVHIFLSDPAGQLGKLAEDAVRAGRFRCHVNSDGSLLVQSVADIAFEKVVAIPVPIQLRREDDLAGEQVPNQDTLTPSPVANDWKPSAADSMFEMAFQLREYARWLNNQLAFARFRQMPKDWKVPTEQASAQAAPADGVRWVRSYACIRIYRDGSVQSLDAYGNAVTMSAVGVQVSSTRDLLLQAAGSVNIVAGRDVNIRARRNVSATADTGKLSLKGHGVQALSWGENLVLETSEPHYTFLASKLRLDENFEVQRDGTLRCAGQVFVQQLTASGSVFAGYLSHGTALLAGLGPHANHVGLGGGGAAVVLDAVTGARAFDLPGGYGPQVQYETLSQAALRRSEVSATGATWDLTSDPDLDSRTQPWPGNMTYRFAAAGESLQTPSTQEAFANQPQPVDSGPAVLRYHL